MSKPATNNESFLALNLGEMFSEKIIFKINYCFIVYFALTEFNIIGKIFEKPVVDTRKIIKMTNNRYTLKDHNSFQNLQILA